MDNDEAFEKFVTHFEAFKKRPGMYIGTANYQTVSRYMMGGEDAYAMFLGDFKRPPFLDRLGTFLGYLQDHYPEAVLEVWYGIDSIILSHSASDEEACEKYFALYSDYLGEQRGDLTVLDEVPDSPLFGGRKKE